MPPSSPCFPSRNDLSFTLVQAARDWDKLARKNSEARTNCASIYGSGLLSALFSKGVAAGFPSLLLPTTTDHKGPRKDGSGLQSPELSRPTQNGFLE